LRRLSGVRATDSRLRGGWTGGGGIEAAIWDGWTVRAEYLFVQFLEKQRVVGPIGITDPFSDSIVRIAFNYKFGGNGFASRF
jgi:outer membrane immunogenic protein